MLSEVLLSFILVFMIWLAYQRKPTGLPPGKWGWPFIGDLPSPGSSLVEEIKRLRGVHGDIISWRMGSVINIFFFNYKTIKSVLSKTETADRPNSFSFKSTSLFTEKGMFSSSGIIWNNNRRFALRHLKSLGMGKTRLGDSIQNEAKELVLSFKKCTGKPQILPWSINVAVLNVIWKMVADNRYDLEDQEIIYFNKMINDMVKALDGPVKWLDLFHWLGPLLPTPLKRRLGLMVIHDQTLEITRYFEKFIKTHQETIDPNNPRDFIDEYLLEMAKPSSDLIEPDSLENLKICMLNLFVAGTDTVSSTVRWTLIYMAKYPEIQSKVQREIDSVVARDTLPSLHERESLPYTEAMINEVHRVVSLTPFFVPHSTNRDMEVDGFIIPKGSVLMPYIGSCHVDPQYWEKPMEFRPEHFLDSGGKVITKKEGFSPFGVGRRSCVGESMARMELFLFLSALLQNFTFAPEDMDEFREERRFDGGISNLPPEFKLIITERI